MFIDQGIHVMESSYNGKALQAFPNFENIVVNEPNRFELPVFVVQELS